MSEQSTRRASTGFVQNEAAGSRTRRTVLPGARPRERAHLMLRHARNAYDRLGCARHKVKQLDALYPRLNAVTYRPPQPPPQSRSGRADWISAATAAQGRSQAALDAIAPAEAESRGSARNRWVEPCRSLSEGCSFFSAQTNRGSRRERYRRPGRSPEWAYV